MAISQLTIFIYFKSIFQQVKNMQKQFFVDLLADHLEERNVQITWLIP